MYKTKIFQGQIIYLRSSWYSQLIYPLVLVKNLFQSIYNFLLHLIWQELIQGKKVDSEIASLIAFIVFCCISILVYHAEAYSEIILIGSLIIWYLDQLISRHQYYQGNNKINVTLYSVAKDKILLTLKNSLKTQEYRFLVTEVDHISIKKKLFSAVHSKKF